MIGRPFEHNSFLEGPPCFYQERSVQRQTKGGMHCACSIIASSFPGDFRFAVFNRFKCSGRNYFFVKWYPRNTGGLGRCMIDYCNLKSGVDLYVLYRVNVGSILPDDRSTLCHFVRSANKQVIAY